MKINLGCGPIRREGYFGLDLRPLPGVDLACDIKRLPLQSDCCRAVYASNVLEHISDIVSVMEEIYRVCKDSAIVEIIVPYQQSNLANADPTHMRQFNEDSFLYFCPQAWGPVAKSYGFNVNFKVVEISYTYARIGGVSICRLPAFIKAILRRHFNNIALTMRVVLKCVKKN